MNRNTKIHFLTVKKFRLCLSGARYKFHRYTEIMEERYQGKCDLKIMADCCWCLKHDEVEINQCVKFLQRKYLP